MGANATRRNLLIAAIAVLVASLLVYRPAEAGIWWQTLFEWAHVPVFGLISLALLALTPRTWPGWMRILVAFAAAMALAVASETAQIPLKRSASLKDVMSDAKGAASFLLLALAIRYRLAGRIVLVIVAGAILVWSASPLIAMSRTIEERNSRFPVIFAGDFDSERTFVSGLNVLTSSRWDPDRGHIFTRFNLVRGLGPKLEMRDLYADWSAYSTLVLELSVASDNAIEFTLRIHDKAHRRGSQPHDDRFNKRISAAPGWNEIRIPLAEVAAAPRTRTMDMRRIEALIVFSSAEGAERVLDLYEIRLD